MKSFLILVLFLLCSCATKVSHEVDVMTFNIRYGTAKDGENHWLKRKQMVFDLLNKYNPDAVGLQEALDFQIAEILENCPQYASFGVGRERNLKGEHTSVLYKKNKFSIHEAQTFWLSDTPEKPSTSWGNKLLRTATSVRLQNLESGESFYVFNTHFDHRSQDSRLKSVELLSQRISERETSAPFILMGDFNSLSEWPQIQYLIGKNANDWNSKVPMMDVYTTANPENPNAGTFSRFEFGKFGHKIDYIFAEKSKSDVLSAIVVRDSANKRYPSDHFPVYAKLIFK
ncbi:MAG: endonuclease/exonuclease/phosphatase family protein [Lentisphaeraceae bacterium]|nr:endonuclease/exonuclease/phosphatase family protein [Lentisphaeraceae bacterium]